LLAKSIKKFVEQNSIKFEGFD